MRLRLSIVAFLIAGLSALPAAAQENLSYAGYSKEFAPKKQLLLQKRHEELLKTYRQEEQRASESCKADKECQVTKLGFLGAVEKGTLGLDMGTFDLGLEAYTTAERFLTLSENESKATESTKKGVHFLVETVTGHEEIAPYHGEGFERVLMLNFKSIAYMLQGEREAYNVTRRAIDWQALERKRFEEKLADAQTELGEKSDGQFFSQQVRSAYAKEDAKASTVASAYVNPFGYYMAGVIQEFDSWDDPSLISNAAISYKKALELNPGSGVIRQAVQDLDDATRAPRRERLLHVIVNDGFVPEKMVLTYQFQMPGTGSCGVPIKLPYYRSVANKVKRIVLEGTDGKKFTDFAQVADVEALVLRSQQDMAPFITLRVALSAARSAAIAKLCKRTGIFGGLVGDAMSRFAAPDTRSWLTLPSSVQAARLYLSPDMREVAITTYDEGGRKLASQVVTLDAAGPSFVYGRSLNDNLLIHTSPKLWIKTVATSR